MVKDTDIAIYKKLTVSVLWMDDEPLVVGKDYIVKLGTKTISGVITKINYSVDVNTGEHLKTETLYKNEIALCEIVLTEAITADVFTSHKTLGELILIDRVSNMTSACGVVENLSERGGSFTNRASFRLGDLEARGDIFEEFYYDTTSLNVLKYQPVRNTYTVGDEIPIEGNSYRYPENFDIIVLRDNTAVKIRSKIISEIIPLSEYRFGTYPLVNGRGFEILVSSEDELNEFINNYKISDEFGRKKLFCERFRFETYRKIVIQ